MASRQKARSHEWYAGARQFSYGGVWVEAERASIEEIIGRLRARLQQYRQALGSQEKIHTLVISGEANYVVYNAVRNELLTALQAGLRCDFIVGPILSWPPEPSEKNAIWEAACDFPNRFVLYYAPLREKRHLTVELNHGQPVAMVGEIPHPPLQEEFRETFLIRREENKPETSLALDFAYQEFLATKRYCRRLHCKDLDRLPLRLTPEKVGIVQGWWGAQGRHFDTLTERHIKQALVAEGCKA